MEYVDMCVYCEREVKCSSGGTHKGKVGKSFCCAWIHYQTITGHKNFSSSDFKNFVKNSYIRQK